MLKAVIFDLDGTLLDTLEDLSDSVNKMLSETGFPERSIDEIRQFVGNGMKKLVERSLPEKTGKSRFDECYTLFKEAYGKNMNNKTRPYDGITHCLEALKSSGIKTAVVSNKNDDAVKKLCRSYFGDLIDFSKGVTHGIKPKPDPSAVNCTIEEMHLEKEDCIFVGDSDTDILTAKNAELKSIGVLWGFRDKNVLEKAGADFIVKIPEEIIDIIKFKQCF